MKRRNNDILWKGMLEEVFDDLLRFLFPKADEVFDMQRGFEFLDKELSEMYPEPEKKSDTKFVDKLVKVYQKDGREEWILVHVEVQDRHEPLFAKRMFKYYCRIFDRFDRPMTAIALFTGKDGQKMPDRYERSYEGAELTYKYNTLCILDYDDSNLVASDNPFAMVLLAAKKALLRGKHLDSELLQQKLLIAKLLYQKTNRTFMEQLDKISGKTNTMGIIEQVAEIRAGEARAEGHEEGRMEEKIEVIKQLLADKEFSASKIAAIARVSVTFVEKIRKEMK